MFKTKKQLEEICYLLSRCNDKISMEQIKKYHTKKHYINRMNIHNTGYIVFRVHPIIK